MKARFSELAPGQCYRTRGKGKLKKKVGEERAATVGKKGRTSTRKVKGDPVVEIEGCTLEMLGVGLKGGPQAMIEIGTTSSRRRKNAR